MMMATRKRKEEKRRPLSWSCIAYRPLKKEPSPQVKSSFGFCPYFGGSGVQRKGGGGGGLDFKCMILQV